MNYDFILGVFNFIIINILEAVIFTITALYITNLNFEFLNKLKIKIFKITIEKVVDKKDIFKLKKYYQHYNLECNQILNSDKYILTIKN